jgi:hypothetical protein
MANCIQWDYCFGIGIRAYLSKHLRLKYNILFDLSPSFSLFLSDVRFSDVHFVSLFLSILFLFLSFYFSFFLPFYGIQAQSVTPWLCFPMEAALRAANLLGRG